MNFDPPWLPRGTVYGTLLNFRRECALWAPKMVEPPYLAAPRAPVLYVKTANTFVPAGAAVSVTGEAQLGATLGLVIGGFESNEALAGASQAQGKGFRVRGLDARLVGLSVLYGVDGLLPDAPLPLGANAAD